MGKADRERQTRIIAGDEKSIVQQLFGDEVDDQPVLQSDADIQSKLRGLPWLALATGLGLAESSPMLRGEVRRGWPYRRGRKKRGRK